MKKEKILETFNSMGKNIDFDDFLEKLIVIDKIERGLQDIKNKKTLTHQEVELKFKQNKYC